ncbi:Peptidoglycan/LPS O-acetylase OafA/YrhL, contains acyltransferase and SGNH-hydrolase domains [Actinobaculum suis]|uniref:Acyltransferase family protein n=1 Tax=Actinobaculum suis TaxID=1657 RepID=A0A1G7DBX0_9ACTO|nr:acyltransferase family protein [Actinobaculum suis]MDY5153361.1 acyltransferase family protein [Actinobaculum suis]SDE48999.1 Peptidoglycan/LPS O-acetylase OafA/YrhL, contains acyltransferase and SGNH-hydrolase domains [Actinobaculum suis]
MQVKQHQRVRGLDGLRAIAAFIVLVFHIWPGGIGYIGVDVFFVLSGFLITSLLTREYHREGRIDLPHFWRKRIRRLTPAVTVATIGTLALARIVGGDALVQLPWQAFGAVTGTYNWFQVANGSSYFESQSPRLLTNMWSLAVEQQFYLLWPLVVLALVALVGSRRIAVWTCLGIAAASAICQQVLVSGADDVTRAYVGTDSHAFGLMIGAAIAFALPEAINGAPLPVGRQTKKYLGIGSWVCLAALVLAGVFAPETRFMYPWGSLLACLASAVVILGLLGGRDAAAHRLVNLLDKPVMVWLGERSYGIYLWHWPLIVLGFYAFNLRNWTVAVIVIPLSILLAHLSFKYVETPVRKHGFRACARSFVHGWLVSGGWRERATAALTAVAIVLAGWALATSQPQSSAEEYVTAGQKSLENRAGKGAASASPDDETPHGAGGDEHDAGSDKQAADSQASGGDNSAAAGKTGADADTKQTGAGADSAAGAGANQANDPAGAGKPQVTEPPFVPLAADGSNVTVIGDSVTVAASPALQERMPNIAVDGEVSRSIKPAPGIISSMKQQGTLRPYVVLALATNGSVSDADWAAVKQALGEDHRIVLVTGYGPANKTWIREAAEKIREIAATDPHVRVADWEPIAAAHEEHLAGDRVHPDPTAAGLYADEILRALQSF